MGGGGGWGGGSRGTAAAAGTGNRQNGPAAPEAVVCAAKIDVPHPHKAQRPGAHDARLARHIHIAPAPNRLDLCMAASVPPCWIYLSRRNEVSAR